MKKEAPDHLIEELAQIKGLTHEELIDHPDFLKWKQDYEFWEKYARIYPTLEVARPYKHLMQTISSFVKPEQGHVWLDAGCGPGSTIDLILNNGEVEKVIGFDFNQQMLKHVTKRFTNHAEKNKVAVHSHDLRFKVPYPDNYFNGIVSNLVLPYITEHQGDKNNPLKAVLSEMHRLLKPHGHLIWTTPVNGVDFTKVFLASWREVLDLRTPKNLVHGPAILGYALKIQKKGKSGEYSFWPKDTIREEMERAGFSNIEIIDTFAGQAHVVKGTKKE